MSTVRKNGGAKTPPPCPKNVRATVYVDAQNWQTFRLYCLSRRVSASQMINSYLHLQVAEWTREAGGVYTPTERTKMWQTAQEDHVLNNAAGDLALINGIKESSPHARSPL